ncbi:MAG: MFS transporter [Deltaproteobacteria bacterium]|nr:MFS transporter [Deltaproteobacteria bacterium]
MSKINRIEFMFRSLHHRNYRLFFIGQFISLIGVWMQSVAQSWLVYSLTHSAMTLGLVGFASQIPSFIVSPLGGVFADKYDKRKMLYITNASSLVLALILSILTLMGIIQVWHILILGILFGVVNGFDMPTRQAFVIEMVGKQDLVNAIALNSSLFNGTRMIGPAIAGILVALFGEGWCFFINSLSYVAILIALLLMQLQTQKILYSSSLQLTSIVEGFRFVIRAQPIRNLLILMGIVNLVGVPYMVLMPIFADHILGAGPSGLGILMSMAGAGALLGALSLAMKMSIRGLSKWITFASIGFGLSLIIFSQSKIFWLSCIFLLITGFTMVIQMASTNTLIQAMVPNQLRGRVMSFYIMVFTGMMPFGSLFAGALAKSIGAPLTLMMGGCICILGAIWFGRGLAEFKTKALQLIAAQQKI